MPVDLHLGLAPMGSRYAFGIGRPGGAECDQLFPGPKLRLERPGAKWWGWGYVEVRSGHSRTILGQMAAS